MCEASGCRIPLKAPADATIAIRLLPRRLEEVAGPSLMQLIVMQRKSLLERRRERYDAILATFALIDADLAPVEVHVDELDGYQLADAHSCVEQRLDQHQVARLSRSPDRLVIPADHFFAGYVREPFGCPRHDDSELNAELTKDLFQIGIVGPLLTKIRHQLTGFALGRCALWDQLLGSAHAAASSVSSSSRSARFSEND